MQVLNVLAPDIVKINTLAVMVIVQLNIFYYFLY